MTGEDFKRLHKGSGIEMDDKTYEVLDIDKMGRVQMQKVEYYVDLFDYSDEHFDTYEDAEDYLMDEYLKGELDVEDIEETMDELKFADIEHETFGKPFWMHYRDIDGYVLTL